MGRQTRRLAATAPPRHPAPTPSLPPADTGVFLDTVHQSPIQHGPVPFVVLRPRKVAPREEARIFHLHDERVDLVHGLAYQVAHLVLVEARHLGPRRAAPLGDHEHDVRIIPGLGYRGQAPVPDLQPRLYDAHQRQDSCQDEPAVAPSRPCLGPPWSRIGPASRSTSA